MIGWFISAYKTVYNREGEKKKNYNQDLPKVTSLVVPLINHFDNTSTPMVFHGSDIMLLQHIHVKHYV